MSERKKGHTSQQSINPINSKRPKTIHKHLQPIVQDHGLDTSKKDKKEEESKEMNPVKLHKSSSVPLIEHSKRINKKLAASSRLGVYGKTLDEEFTIKESIIDNEAAKVNASNSVVQYVNNCDIKECTRNERKMHAKSAKQLAPMVIPKNIPGNEEKRSAGVNSGFQCKTVGKKFEYHSKRIVPYLTKRRIHNDTLVFIFNTGDDYMKRAFIRRGWVENTVVGSQLFDLRWDLNENSVDFEQLRPGQLCNHFPNNQELTTKTGLARSLPRLTDYGCDYEAWFPRCYDFTDERQIESFVQDFQKTSIVNFVKKHALYFKRIHGKEMNEIKHALREGQMWTKRIANNYKGIYLPLPNGTKNIINMTLLKAAIAFIEYQIKLRTDVLNENVAEKWFKRSKAIRNAFETLATMGQYSLPYSSNVFKEISQAVPEGWDIPSAYLEYKTIFTVKKFDRAYPQSRISGTENIWIVKPSFSSRGIGIHCINSPKEAFTGGKKMQAKVVQKYIERPFLLWLPGPTGKLEKRKFDIRQWVLVTSMSPLVIYMFNSCYLKICGSEFVLDEFKDKYRHISNFSIQKNNARINDIKSDLVMSIPQFVEHLWHYFGIKLDWQANIFPKLSKIVKETVYSAWDTVEHKPNSFELYGFDFVLDYKLDPWLIEVNLSPACCERTDWLIDMLRTFTCL